jgi:AcrR family transcriptional regulator
MTAKPASIRHIEATRNAILEAAMDLFLERQSDGFSVQEVADRAGLTHRTVYRYFPTRQELLGATAERLAPAVVDQRFAEVSTVEEWIDAIGAHFAHTEANFELVRRVVAALFTSDDMRLFGRGIRDRDADRWDVFRRQFPHLPEDDARRTFATLRHLMSSTSYVLHRLRFGLSPAEATRAIQSAASQIVEQAARRDRAAKQGRRRRS